MIRIVRKKTGTMNKIRENKKRFFKILMAKIKLSAVAIMLIFTFVGASAEVQAFGFSLFGYHVSNQGVEKQDQDIIQDSRIEKAQERQVIQEKEQIKEKEKEKEQVRENRDIQKFGANSENKEEPEISIDEKIDIGIVPEEENSLVDIEESLRLANADKYLTSNLKSLEGENFCIRTDQRLAYFTVNQDGTIGWFEGEPSKYHIIQTTEMFSKKSNRKSKKWRRNKSERDREEC